MAITNESLKKIYKGDLQRILFPNNDFIQHSIDDVADIGASSIEVPQETIEVESGKNPDTYPLEVQNGSNNKRSYGADLYYTKPFHIPNREQDVLNYNKRSAMLMQKTDKLNTDFADDVAYAWAPTVAANIVRTTGPDVSAKLSGATGTRKAAALADYIEVNRILDNMEVPRKGRVGLLSANMYAEIVTAGLEGFIGADKLSSDLIADGVVGMLFGVKLYTRSRIARYSNAGNPQKIAPNTAAAGTDNDVSLIWHPSFVRKGKSAPTVFTRTNDPLYLGSIANCSITAGADIARNDQKGVVALVQAHGA